jgi:hypothetical protein
MTDNHLFRAIAGEVVDTNQRKREVTAVWSTCECDHFRTVFDQRGIDTSVFRDNPVILWEHGQSAERSTLPMANATQFGLTHHRGDDALVGTSKFWDDEFGSRRFEDYAAGRLKGWSIRAVPLKKSPPTADECRARPGWRDAETVYRSTKLIEVSGTSLPGNASTLTLKVERSVPGRFTGVTAEARGVDDGLARAIREEMINRKAATRMSGERNRCAFILSNHAIKSLGLAYDSSPALAADLAADYADEVRRSVTEQSGPVAAADMLKSLTDELKLLWPTFERNREIIRWARKGLPR